MSRSLPLSREVADAANASDALSPAPRLRGEVEVVDSAMCCSSGLCGPGVDPALLAIARDLRWLEKHAFGNDASASPLIPRRSPHILLLPPCCRPLASAPSRPRS